MSRIRIPLSGPDVTESEIRAVVDVLRSDRLSLGPTLGRFEAALADLAAVRAAVATNSGTNALHLCMRALDIGAEHEVITSPFSFIASANVIAYVGARPVFVDIDPRTLNLDPERVERAVTSRTRAILAVHAFARPAAMEALADIAGRHGLDLIEDAAEAIGGLRGGRPLGSFGRLGVYAFYPNKQITTGEGGAVLGSDAGLTERIRCLRNQGRDPGGANRYVELGYSYRLPDLNCALGLEQLRRLPAILARRERVARMYDERLRDDDDWIVPEIEPDGDARSWFVYVIRLADRFSESDRDRIAARLQDRGIGIGRYFPPIHVQPWYRERYGYAPGDFPLTEHVSARTLALPFYNRLEGAAIDEVCDELRRAVAAVRSAG